MEDGVPFLMDLDTALRRRMRCHACPRCPDRMKPPGTPLMHALRHLGYPEDSAAAEEALAQSLARFGKTHEWQGDQRVACCQLPCGVQLWLERDFRQDQPHDCSACFFSGNAMYLDVERQLRAGRPGRMLRSLFIANARSRVDSTDRLVNNAFESPNLSSFDGGFIQQGSYVAQVTAFPQRLSCFDSKEAYLAAREVSLGEQSFVSGLAMSGADEADPPAEALITGVVKEASLITNDVTGLPFYHISLRCLGLVFDVVAAPSLLEAAPRPGQVLQGRFFLSARITDYGRSGYRFEVDVSTPLTAARFEAIRAALSCLQPGEKLYCGIDPPLGEITFLRAKGEVEGVSVEFRLDVTEGEGDDEDFRILRFYPVSRQTALRIFERTLVHQDPPLLSDARDVTHVYREAEACCE